jgi:hypothetical protein
VTHLRTLISAAGATVTRPAKALKRTAVPPVGALAYAQIVKNRQRNNVYAFVLDNILDWNDFEGKRGATRVSVRCTAHEKKKEKKRKTTHTNTHTRTRPTTLAMIGTLQVIYLYFLTTPLTDKRGLEAHVTLNSRGLNPVFYRVNRV